MNEPKFVPKPGQVDYTNIRYAPALDVIVVHDSKILLAKRSANRRLYPNYWATIDGFLDDDKSIEEKAYEELLEEVGIVRSDVTSITRGQVMIQEDAAIGKTWLIVPVLAQVKTDKFTLDWEASEARWFAPKEVAELDLLPGALDVIGQFFPEVM
jgi:NADH pyrophosphatase NudC (nudix superfamily)